MLIRLFTRALSVITIEDVLLPQWMPTTITTLTHIVIHSIDCIQTVDIRQLQSSPDSQPPMYGC